MTDRIRLAAAATLVAAATPLVLAAGGHAKPAAGRTLTLHVHGTVVRPVDLPPYHTSPTSPETAGDIVTDRSSVSGDARGHRYLDCIVVKPGRGYDRALSSCRATYVLRGGTVTAQGVVRLAASKPLTVAVTGGTGRYADARGSLRSAPSGTDTLTLR